jgi:CDP-diacylglycerol---glycerol-3-phosphate 3-phosphatidyltransferase
MDIGLYTMKYPARKLIAGVLPWFRSVNPNTVSLLLLPVGVATAITYYLGAAGAPWLYLVGIGLIFLRMFLGILDGLIAVHYHKATPQGEMINCIAPELCDAFYLVALTVARPAWVLPGIGALTLAWLTSFAGTLGTIVGKPIQSAGPAGQTDRLAALMAFSLLAFFSANLGWGIDFIAPFLYWTIIGGGITVCLRLLRYFKAA